MVNIIFQTKIDLLAPEYINMLDLCYDYEGVLGKFPALEVVLSFKYFENPYSKMGI